VVGFSPRAGLQGKLGKRYTKSLWWLRPLRLGLARAPRGGQSWAGHTASDSSPFALSFGKAERERGEKAGKTVEWVDGDKPWLHRCQLRVMVLRQGRWVRRRNHKWTTSEITHEISPPRTRKL